MEYSVRLGLVDNLTGSLNKANKGIQDSVGKVSALGKSLAGLGVTLGVGAVLGAVKTLTEALEDQYKADKRVNDNAYAYGKTLGYTQEQIDKLYQSTLDYAGASQDKGVFGDEELERMMAQNMQMGVQADLLDKVGDMTRDYTVRMKGAGASQEDLLEANKKINTAIVGGTLPTLKKFGISLGNITAEQFKAMTQQERATAIMEAFNKASITGADENVRKDTMLGHFTAIKKNLGDIIQEVAKWTLPSGLSNSLQALDDFVVRLKYDFMSVKNPIDLLKLEIGGMVEQFQKAFPHLSKLLCLLGTVGAIAGVIYGLVQAFIAVKSAILAVQVAFQAFTLLVSANPIVIALYAIIGVMILIYTYWDEISAIASSCWETITTGCQAFIDYAVGAWEAFSSTISGVFDSIAQKVQWLWDNTPLPKVFDIISRGIGWVSNVAGSVIGKGNATGTNYFEGGLTHVNEAGGEIMNLPNGTQIIPHDISQKMASGGGNNVTVNVNISGNVIDDGNFIDRIGQTISDRVSLALANS